MTNRQHFDKGFDLAVRGVRVRRLTLGAKVTAAFLSGWRMGRIALSRAYDDAYGSMEV